MQMFADVSSHRSDLAVAVGVERGKPTTGRMTVGISGRHVRPGLHGGSEGAARRSLVGLS